MNTYVLTAQLASKLSLAQSPPPTPSPESVFFPRPPCRHPPRPLASPSEVEGPGVNGNPSVFLSSPLPDVALPASRLAKPNFYWSNFSIISMFSFLFTYPSRSSLDRRGTRYPSWEDAGWLTVEDRAVRAGRSNRLYYFSYNTRLCSEIGFVKRGLIQAEATLESWFLGLGESAWGFRPCRGSLMRRVAGMSQKGCRKGHAGLWQDPLAPPRHVHKDWT